MRSNRFASWLLLGCLLFVLSCDDEKTVPTSGAVGHVAVVKGEVSAKRPGEPVRNVQVEDMVYADDTIVTGENSSVQIQITHNMALWELGASSERRIDKGIAFRAETKGASPLSKKETVATAAAGRGTTREAGDSVGTVQASEGAPEPASEEESLAPVAQPTAKPRPVARKEQASPGRRSAARTRAPAKAVRPAKSAEVTVPAPSASAPMQNVRDEVMEGDNLTDEDSRGGETRAKKKVQSLASAQRAHIVSLAQQCHRNHGGTGTLSFRVGANGALNVSSSASSLNMVVTCLEAAIRKNALPNDAAVSGSLQLP